MQLPAVPELDLVRHTLDNGLRVVVHPDRSLPLVAVNLWYHVGSKNERPGRTGFAHLFEHMLFQGSEHVGTNDHFGHVQKVGGVANGSTSRDRTNYYETLPAEHLELGLWLESDRMGFLLPAMTEEKLENQRQVVMNERRQRVDNLPYGRANERLHELLFPADHPYHWPVIGYMDDIAAAQLDQVRTFFATYYRPNNAVLTLAGDLDADAALTAVERWFAALPAGSPPPAVGAELAPLGGEQREVLPDAVRLPRVYVAYRTPPLGERGWYAADLLSTALSDGKSSPLYEELVYRRQIAHDVGSLVFSHELTGTFLLMATVKPGVDPAEVEAVLLEQVAEAAERPPAGGDLERAKNRLLTDHFSQLQRIDGRADLLSQLTTYFDAPERLANEVERYLELAGSDLADFATQWCNEDERVVVTVVPQEATP
jgi:zinc protease